MSRTEDATPRSRRAVLASGTGRRALGQEPWVSPHRGYHRDDALHDPVRQRILDAATVMPDDGVVGGWAAAYLHGVTHLDGLYRGGELPVLVVVPQKRQVSRPGIRVLRSELEEADVSARQHMRCTRPARTAYDMLRLAPSLTSAVIVGDCLLRAGVVSADGISEYAAERPGRRGMKQLRTAVPLLDGGAASPPESRLRMLCRFDAGLPPLLVNVPVYGTGGQFLGMPDLFEPGTGLAIEYDGEYHRELEQHTADNLREERLEAAGIAVVRITSLDLRNRSALATRLSAAYNRRPHLLHPTWSLTRHRSAA